MLNRYSNIIEKLKDAGIIKTAKVVGDYGEYIASKKLHLELMDSPQNKGYDAKDLNGKKYEIKTRKATKTNFPKSNNTMNFSIKSKQLSKIDFLVYVEFTKDWNIKHLLKIPKEEVDRGKEGRVLLDNDSIEKNSKK